MAKNNSGKKPKKDPKKMPMNGGKMDVGAPANMPMKRKIGKRGN